MSFIKTTTLCGMLLTGYSALTTTAFAEEPMEPTNASIGYTDEEINEMINNPLSALWILFTQNDTTWYTGDALDAVNEDDKVFNTTLINPVMPMQLTDDVRWVFRPAIPIHSFETPSLSRGGGPGGGGPSVDWDRETGLGDVVLFNVFTSDEGARPPNVWGAGFTTMLDTASHDSLGFGKWCAGPALMGLRITDKWIYGVVYQHWWDFAGSDSRNDVNLTDLQYIIRYRLTDETNIGIAPNIRYDWEQDSDDALTLPIGIGADTMVKIGPLPVKVGLETYYYVEKPDAFGPEWQVRLIFTPVLPSPKWAKKPIF